MITELQITQLRNIKQVKVHCHPHVNVISGPTGSGKTSFLEALYLLCSGQSFRTRETKALIAEQCDNLTVFGKTKDEHRISIQKSLSAPTIGQLNGIVCTARSELASLLPCQVVYQDIFQIIDAGSSVRRGLLDWGLFHVEHNYHHLWNDYRRTVKQRNALLRSRASKQTLEPWSYQLAELASRIDLLRRSYFEKLNQAFQETNQQLSEVDCGLAYYRGWDRKNEGKSLQDILEASYHSDSLRQYTQYGAHHADIVVISRAFKAKHYLSRGQQKTVLLALKLAQAKLMHQSCVFLIDDVTAELDTAHITRLMHYLNSLNGQIFMSVQEQVLLSKHFKEYACVQMQRGEVLEYCHA